MNRAFDLAPDDWSALRALLDEGLALSPPQRAGWLAGLDAARHAAVLPHLRDLLAAAEDGAAPTLGTLPTVDTRGMPPGAAVPAPAQEGQLVGPYRLVRELGRGGMASVWLAERTDMLQGRQVALKLPHGAWGATQRAALAERLAREREILATLEHPHIARLYDAGIDAGGQPWLALEYVQGERIDRYVQAQALHVPARLRLFLQVARAVAYAHSRLVVHRDLKPANILVTDAGQVRLLDFGIAKLLEAEGAAAAEATELTQQGGRALTPQYAAPEQVLGEPITTRADVYALGVVLFELLTGERPYAPRRDSRAALEEAVAAAEVRRPSDVVADARLRRRLRGDLDTVVATALRRRPEARYPTVDALAEDIERHLERRPLRAQPDSALYRLGRFVARNRVAVAAGSAVGLAVLAGSGVALWQAQAARREQQRAEAVKDFVAAVFREAAPHGGSGSTQLGAIDVLKLAEARMRSTPQADPAVGVELSAVLADGLMSFGDIDAAEPLLAQAASTAAARLAPHDPQALRVAVLQAQVHRLRGRGEQARALLDATLPVLRAQAPAAPRELVTALTHRALAAFEQAAYADAERFAEEGAQLAATRLAADDELRVSSPIVLALAYSYTQKFSAARDVSSAGLAAAIARYGEKPPHPRVAEARNIHGRALALSGDVAAGAASIDAAVADMRMLFGDKNPQLGITLQNLVGHRMDLGQLDAAERNAAEALQILSAVAQPESLTYAGTLSALGQVRLARRDAAAALADLERAAGLLEKAIGPDKEFTVLARAGRALALAYLGRAEEARAAAAALPEPPAGAAPGASAAVSTPAARWSPATHARLVLVKGAVARRTGDAAAAERWLQPLADGDDTAPKVQRERMRARAELGLLHEAQGQGPRAVQRLEQALGDADRLEAAATPMRTEAQAALARLRPAAASASPR